MDSKDGCFAEYMTIDTSLLHIVPDELPDTQAIFTEPLAADVYKRQTVHRGQGKGEKVRADQNQHMPGCKVYFCPPPPTSKKDFLVRSKRMVYNT